MANHAGWQRWVTFIPESTWGTTPSSGTQYWAPVTQYGVKAEPVANQVPLFAGVRDQIHNRKTKINLGGGLSCPLWAHHVGGQSIAQRFIAAAISAPDGLQLSSFTFRQHEEDTDNKAHSGIVFNSMTIQGSADNGQVSFQADLQGKKETGGVTVGTISNAEFELSEFLMDGVTLTIDSTTIEILSFNLSVRNNCDVRHLATGGADAKWPAIISNGTRQVSFSFNILKTADTYDALRRSIANDEFDVELELVGDHRGTGGSGTNTVITFTMPRCSFQNAGENVNLGRLVEQNVQMLSLKPAAGTYAIQATYGTS